MIPGNSDESYMRQAILLAQTAAGEGEVPIGALIVWDGKIIGRGYNQVEKLQDATAHAEMLAITAAAAKIGSKFLTGATLYVTIEPCLMCCGALYWSRLGRIVYGADDIKNGYGKYLGRGSTGTNPFHPKTQLVKGVLEAECAALVRDFFAAKR